MKQAKKRDHKIMITDVAIRKVPVVYIPQFSQNACEWIADEHRELLNIAREQNNSDEVLFVLFGQEQKSIIFGDEFSVDLGESASAYSIFAKASPRDVMLLHNHPSTNSFSLSDIVVFLRYAQIGIMSVVTNQGDVHILHKTPQFDYNKAKRLFHSIFSCYQDDTITHNEAVKYFLKECSEGGIVYVRS